jgi:hypothetical protein
LVIPLRTSITYENRTKLLIGMRIDRLKGGDWARDTSDDVLRTIEQDKAAIVKESNSLKSLFLVLLACLAASDVVWLIFHSRMHMALLIVQTTVVAIIVVGIAAQYWVWPKWWRSALAELDSYRAEAAKLSPPTPATAAEVHHRHNRDLWVAAGGLIIGAVLARAGGVLRRSDQP